MKDFIKIYECDCKRRKRDLYKNTTKEERAYQLDNIICNRCKYQNRKYFVMKYGKCNLCGATLDVNYFKKMLLKKLKED